MDSKTVKVPIYFGKIKMMKGNLNKVAKKYDLKSMDGFSAVTFKIDDNYYMAFSKGWTPSIVAHEALHIVAMIFDDVGADFDTVNDEHQCYLLGWIVEECHKFLNKKR